DGKMLAVWSFDGGAHLWDVGSQRQIATPEPADRISAVASSAVGNLLATGHRDGTVSLWSDREVRSGAARSRLATLRGLNGNVNRLWFSADGRELFAKTSDTVKGTEACVWDAGRRRLTTMIAAMGNGPPTSVACSPVGRALALGSFERPIHLWRFPGGTRTP